MQLNLIIRPNHPCVLPIAYHHLQQSAIYSLLRGNVQTDDLHNQGVNYGDRRYKLFTFGPLEGHYSISNGKIIYWDKIKWEIRSCNPTVIRVLEEEIQQKGIILGENSFDEISIQKSDVHIKKEHVTIQMISPVCVYSTNNQRRTVFYSPEDTEFEDAIKNNFWRKYVATYGAEPESQISINKVKVTKKDKYVTKYKGFYINAWKGIYELSGESLYLDFLYQVGIGAKNSQGFGMFRLYENDVTALVER